MRAHDAQQRRVRQKEHPAPLVINFYFAHLAFQKNLIAARFTSQKGPINTLTCTHAD